MRNEVKSNRYYIKSITQEKKVQKKKRARAFFSFESGVEQNEWKKVFNIYTHTERALLSFSDSFQNEKTLWVAGPANGEGASIIE